MEGDELAADVAAIMQSFPDMDWCFLARADFPHELFVVEIRPIAAPDRCAHVEVSDSMEVFGYRFAGHWSVDFAYERADKRELLEDTIKEAITAVRGPTRVLLDWGGNEVLRSGISIAEPGNRLPPLSSSMPLRVLWWRLRGRSMRRELLSFPALPVADR